MLQKHGEQLTTFYVNNVSSHCTVNYLQLLRKQDERIQQNQYFLIIKVKERFKYLSNNLLIFIVTVQEVLSSGMLSRRYQL
jgi:hypothetical protein